MGVQVPLPAPEKNLLELFKALGLMININSRNGIDFFVCLKESEEIQNG